MSERETRDGIDPDRTDGAAKNLGGKLKEGAGKLVGDEKLKHEGQADQVKGKLQNAWGGLKDEVRDMDREDDR